uniref:Uncharacterized protein n=1 Tax=Anopheles maculatus TaxID=74869 RepID=A0A182T017_9DIPT
VEESTIRQRLGGRRDSAAQISGASPPSTSPPPGAQRRRRSSLAQLTDILREWSGGGSKRQKAPLNRRETLADLARSLPWNKATTADTYNNNQTNSGHAPPLRKRRESSADSGVKSWSYRRDSHASDFRKEREWERDREKEREREKDRERERERERERDRDDYIYSADNYRNGSRRNSNDSSRDRSSRRDSTIGGTATPPPPPKVVGAQRKRKDSLVVAEMPNFRQEQRPSTSSTASDSGPLFVAVAHVDSACQALPPPTIITSSVTPPATSPTAQKGRRDSTTQCGTKMTRRDSRVSPERAQRLSKLQRQATAYDESCLPPGGWSRRSSQPALSPDGEGPERQARRDSLSPDSASRGRRDSRSHLSPDRSHEREGSPRRSRRLRRQSSSAARQPRSPDSSSCCSSRDASPCARPPPPTESTARPSIRRQSTTEEILIARGFRRQSTTEEMIRCRNFRRQSSQSDDTSRYRGRRDSSAQIIDGTIGTMTVETTSTFFDSSTQTGMVTVTISPTILTPETCQRNGSLVERDRFFCVNGIFYASSSTPLDTIFTLHRKTTDEVPVRGRSDGFRISYVRFRRVGGAKRQDSLWDTGVGRFLMPNPSAYGVRRFFKHVPNVPLVVECRWYAR